MFVYRKSIGSSLKSLISDLWLEMVIRWNELMISIQIQLFILHIKCSIFSIWWRLLRLLQFLNFSKDVKYALLAYRPKRLVSWWKFHLYNQFKSTSTDEIYFQRLKFKKFTKLRVCKISCEIRRNAYFNLCKHAPYPKLRIERHCLHFILMHYLCIAYIEKTMNHSLW